MSDFRKVAPILLLSLIATVSYGQKKPTWNEETEQVMWNGKIYTIMAKKKSKVITGSNFDVKDHQGNTILNFIYETYGCESGATCFRERVVFTESGSWAHLGATAFGFGQKAVLKTLTQNELIREDGGLYWVKSQEWMRTLGRNNHMIKQPQWIKDQNKPKNTPVIVQGREIYQEGHLVGKVNRREVDSDYVYSVYNKEGKRVMTASIDKDDPFEWILVNAKGEETTHLYEDDSDGIKILTYLASKGIIGK